ncbi:MAG: ORF6N domain-containing protein [Thermoleophilia bacterium]
MTGGKSIIPKEIIQRRIIYLRGLKVMLSTHLAELYEVEPRTLVQAVNRNKHRFPEDFMFLLSDQEFADLKAQLTTTSWGGLRKPPYAFTEQGVAMLSAVLKSERAINVSIEIMRTFVQMRRMLASYEDLAKRLDALEKKYDMQFSAVFDAIRQLMEPPKPKKNQIGFHWEERPAPATKTKPAKKKANIRKMPPTKKKSPAPKKLPATRA